MHISLFHGTPDDYVQVVCHQERYLDRMLAMGWKKSPEDLSHSKETKKASNESRRVN